jgi:hypothetical protein
MPNEQPPGGAPILHDYSSAHNIVRIDRKVLEQALACGDLILRKWAQLVDPRQGGVGWPSQQPGISQEEELDFWGTLEAELSIAQGHLRVVLEALGRELDRR